MRKLIPDLIEAEMDILNPVQISARGMDLPELKQEFGRDLVFWGGGVDTQAVLGTATPDEIREHVKRNVEALAPGGGFQVSYRNSTRIGEHNESELAEISEELTTHTDLAASEIEGIIANLKDMSRKDYEEFARLADIFIDEADFLQRVEGIGFGIDHVSHHHSGADDSFIAVLQRPTS